MKILFLRKQKNSTFSCIMSQVVHDLKIPWQLKELDFFVADSDDVYGVFEFASDHYQSINMVSKYSVALTAASVDFEVYICNVI